jgi:peptide/nickel transport system permease protein
MSVRRALRRFIRHPAAIAAVVLFATLVVVAVFERQTAPYNWDSIDLRREAVGRSPTLWEKHLFGTDVIGRDILSRTIYGLHTTIAVGFGAAALALVIGVPLGLAAGYFRGRLDTFVVAVTDLLTAFPAVMLSLAAIVFFEPVWPHTLAIVLGLYLWTTVARIVRSHTASAGSEAFVEAARALGASDARIIRRHLLPNVLGTVFVAATSVLGQAILLDATIEFFNYGLPASRWPSLGNLLAEVTFSGGLGLFGYRQLGWWTWAFPAAVLALLLTCINLIGDELDAALNPAAVR